MSEWSKFLDKLFTKTPTQEWKDGFIYGFEKGVKHSAKTLKHMEKIAVKTFKEMDKEWKNENKVEKN